MIIRTEDVRLDWQSTFRMDSAHETRFNTPRRSPVDVRIDVRRRFSLHDPPHIAWVCAAPRYWLLFLDEAVNRCSIYANTDGQIILYIPPPIFSTVPQGPRTTRFYFHLTPFSFSPQERPPMNDECTYAPPSVLSLPSPLPYISLPIARFPKHHRRHRVHLRYCIHCSLRVSYNVLIACSV